MSDKLTPKEVAAEQGVTPVTVRNWIKSGRLEAYRVGGRIFVRREALDRFLAGPVYPAASTDKSGGD